eukprot:TRINITY_DN7103_c0_g1_i4.p1 TRINITY_DN7103_c0_g1~~TRINITY_DN7103_c0_g1_i4.p1  ORF type:complete len:207 (-),score=46.44 TRINITY_DN7103_c0_g1_i4:51-671(-)
MSLLTEDGKNTGSFLVDDHNIPADGGHLLTSEQKDSLKKFKEETEKDACTIRVYEMSGKGLIAKDPGATKWCQGTSDPYVAVTTLIPGKKPKKLWKSAPVKKTLNPEWKYADPLEIEEHRLWNAFQFALYDKDLLVHFKSAFMGAVSFPPGFIAWLMKESGKDRITLTFDKLGTTETHHKDVVTGSFKVVVSITNVHKTGSKKKKK